MAKDFINLADFSSEQLRSLLERTLSDKALFRAGKLPASLERKTLAMIFEKQSLRTRVSFETAMTQLGGRAINLAPADIGLGEREPVRDVARVLSRMCDGIMARTFSHQIMEQLVEYSSIPVINGLTDYSHPCQAMADMVTATEHLGELCGKTLAFIGDGNNVARSLAVACGKFEMKFILAAPAGYELSPSFADKMDSGRFAQTLDPTKAVAQADVIYTDTWVSMGQESEKAKRVGDFERFQINSELLAEAPDGAIVLHCLPAHRGLEITDEAIETHCETILDQAENRLHFQRTLLNVLIAEGGIG